MTNLITKKTLFFTLALIFCLGSQASLAMSGDDNGLENSDLHESGLESMEPFASKDNNEAQVYELTTNKLVIFELVAAFLLFGMTNLELFCSKKFGAESKYKIGAGVGCSVIRILNNISSVLNTHRFYRVRKENQASKLTEHGAPKIYTASSLSVITVDFISMCNQIKKLVGMGKIVKIDKDKKPKISDSWSFEKQRIALEFMAGILPIFRAFLKIHSDSFDKYGISNNSKRKAIIGIEIFIILFRSLAFILDPSIVKACFSANVDH